MSTDMASAATSAEASTRDQIAAAGGSTDGKARKRSNRKRRVTPGGVALSTVTIIAVILFLLPVVWGLAVSLKAEGSPIAHASDWFLPPYTLENYPKVLAKSGVWTWFMNSLLVAVASTALTLIVTPMAAYAIARIPFRGSRLFYIYFILGMMIPVEAMIIPLFITANKLHLVDTYAGLILPGVASSLNLIIMVSFFRQIPEELMDAARIDGAGAWRSFLSIVLPLSRTIMVTVGIFAFTGSWNNYLWPLLVSMSADKFTLPVGIPTFAGTYTVDYVMPMTANMVASLPMIILFVIFERYIVKGVSTTGIKG
ncbi:MAG: carbohydrate ABC transporter permease [Actinomyces sp.]|jgi:multiple sugar transport system permease protein|nr:carbohydrate ABC transporter permease [Actinomyces sp.]MCI1788338.1 carbohydrate ABC transporter permease [Actinomyces sp.]